MIVFLRGIIASVGAGSADVDVGGVGYRVWITEPHALKLSVGDETHIYTYHHVREDAVQLFGFESESMHDWFELLIGVSGIGPKGALQILSGVTAAEFARAIANDDVEALCRLPGIGKKTAQRLIVELKEKVARFEWEGLTGQVNKPAPSKLVASSMETDAIAALVSLGYPDKFAADKVKKVLEENSYDSVAEVIRATLRQLAP